MIRARKDMIELFEKHTLNFKISWNLKAVEKR